MRLVSAYITENDCDWLELSIKSVVDVVDKIYVIYSPTLGDKTPSMLKQFGDKVDLTVVQYPHNSKGADGTQRNEYLKILKEREMGSWCLVLDSDEAVDHPEKIKPFLETQSKDMAAFSVKMRHLIRSLGHEDYTAEVHLVPLRLFRVSEELFYDAVEHPVLKLDDKKYVGNTDCVTIFHFGMAKELLEVLRKYKNNLEKSNVHSKKFLRWWYMTHILDSYPKRPVDPDLLPDVIKEKFDIVDIKDELYFNKRKELQVNHLLDAYQWKDFFKPKSVLLCGDGIGVRTVACGLAGLEAEGFDISDYAVRNRSKDAKNYWKQSILDPIKSKKTYDLVVSYDILEHLEIEDLQTALQNMYRWSNKYILISVPTIGDPNLEADPTHKIKKSMEWWKEQVVNNGFKLIEPLEHFAFKHQLIIGEKI